MRSAEDVAKKISGFNATEYPSVMTGFDFEQMLLEAIRSRDAEWKTYHHCHEEAAKQGWYVTKPLFHNIERKKIIHDTKSQIQRDMNNFFGEMYRRCESDSTRESTLELQKTFNKQLFNTDGEKVKGK